ncbi:hypothetical protein CONPUDRAFT_169051 [Coniophora puteana RWD-64-598 SS2]|uniref:Uncharacterized protein n=1 Tax=Coniophora puteana (strain RWD-64-598) TaxID=741705 RepID=A0A5M3M9C9_CONPW|nr:uncharacterized protein CONPUDRAFT_169051 [Coniophora puteana RWD-64-598 SS2]EIW75769.1 hypothetical protein CONPUDRAFT_169051 [Coniophora puteana RWD-64-598 SS2]
MVRRQSHIEIDHGLRTINAQVESLQQREDELARALAEVQAKKRSLLQQRVQLEIQKQPINWLPSELLCRVFYHVIWQEPMNDKDPRFSAQRRTFYPDAITLSHVCGSWRQVVLSTSRLWAYISYRTRRWSPKALGHSLERAGTSPVDLVYSVRACDVRTKRDAHEEVRTGKRLIRAIIRRYSHRLRSLHLTFHEMAGMDAIVTALSRLYFPMLEQLELNAPPTKHQHLSSETSTLNFLRQSPTSWFNSLTSMHVQRVPLRCFSRHVVTNLRALKLSFYSKESLLPADELFQFLAYAPRIEDLTLDNVWFDWKQSTATSSSNIEADNLPSATLPRLHRFTWHGASAVHVGRLMSSLHMPRLQFWDLIVLGTFDSHDCLAALARHAWQGSLPMPPSNPPPKGVHTLSALSDLTVQCHDADELGEILCMFTCPALERLELGFLDPDMAVRAGTTKLDLPRAGSLFRDPRLPALTHLVLSDFVLGGGRGCGGTMRGSKREREMEVEDVAMLRYMPGLVSLTLVVCAGAGVLLRELARTCPSGRLSGNSVAWDQGVGARVCPKLEEITLMSCRDVAFTDIVHVVHLRSGQQRTTPLVALDVNTNGDTRAPPASGACLSDSGPPNPNTVASAAACDAPPPPDPPTLVQRKIVPLRRRLKQTAQDPSAQSSHAPTGGLWTMPMTMFSMGEALRPAKLVCVYIDDCPLVTRRDADALEGMGVMVSYS